MDDSYKLIETAGSLGRVSQILSDTSLMGVDLEADSLFHYREKICLLQIATEKLKLVIDPLTVKDLSPLQPIFADRSIRKVFHGADYDIRSLYRDFKIEVNNLFDTQVACRFLGMKETGLEAVLHQRFNVILEKAFQKKDWSQRPLPEEMLRYAIVDVAYLIPLTRMVEKELNEMGRSEWVEEECRNLSQVRPQSPDKGPRFLRVKGAARLDARTLAVLEALLQFRQEQAGELDRPPFKILANEILLKISQRKPLTLNALEESKILNEKQISRWGTGLLESIRQALDRPERDLPFYPRERRARMPADIRKRVEALKAWRNERGEKMGLEPGILLNNNTIQFLAMNPPRFRHELDEVPALKNWQRDTFGEEIVDRLQGI